METGVFTLADISSADWSLALDGPGAPGSGFGQVVQGTADVDQCIRIILTTPKGSDPLRPTFGADIWQYIDYPINAAIPAIVREVTQAITVWEPRVTLTGVKALPIADGSTQSGAHLEVRISWRLRLSRNGAVPPPFAPERITTITIPTQGLA
jgi:phage baseplate assembly protein W